MAGNQVVLTPEQAKHWMHEEQINDTLTIGPLSGVVDYVVITPEMVHAMSPEERASLRRAVESARLSTTVARAVSGAVFGAITALTGWGR